MLSTLLLHLDKPCNFSHAKSFALTLSLTLAGLISSGHTLTLSQTIQSAQWQLFSSPHFLHNKDAKNALQSYLVKKEKPGLDFHQKESAQVNKQRNQTLQSHEM